MTGQRKDANHLLIVDWEGVRPIYKKLSDEFHILLSAFDVTIDNHTKIYLDHLICCIDEVDKILDSQTDKIIRDGLSQQMISIIKGSISNLSKEFPYPLLEKRLLTLKEITELLKVKSRVVDAAEIIFGKTEAKRHVKSLDVFLPLVRREGMATSELPLSIIGDQSNENFDKFFKTLCGLMGVADLVVDAGDDFKEGIISFKPTIKTQLTLVYLTIRDGLSLLKLIPKKTRFFLYCLRFGLALIKGN